MKKLIAVVLAAATFAVGTFAKDNPRATTYQTHEVTSASAPAVYFIRDISADALVKVYNALGWRATGKVGVKISTGEPPRSNYLRPDLIRNLVQSVNGTLVESNTSYGGRRASVAAHKQVARDHFPGFAFDLLDEDGSMTIPVANAKRLTRGDYVGTHFTNYDSYIVLSHFKGHAMAGFGGAIKNMSIGFGSGQSNRESGKVYIHSGGTRTSGSIMGSPIPFLEAMAEAAKGVADYMGRNIVYINVMNRLSVDCDCDGNPAAPDMHDIGILASLDQLALDQACVDLVYKASDSGSLIDRIESRQGLHTLDYAEQIGVGQRNYRLVTVQ